ncbi:MAG: hypothetical protein ACK504_07140 [Bacteroidota bacterium]|jgi:hypothetical protein
MNKISKPPIEIINLTFSALMVTLTTTGFFVFLFTNLFSDRVIGLKRVVLALIFLAYAFYRSYRIYKVLKKNSESKID